MADTPDGDQVHAFFSAVARAPPSFSLSVSVSLPLSVSLPPPTELRGPPPGHFPHCPRLSEVHGVHSSIPLSVLRPEAAQRRKECRRTPRASAGGSC